MIAPRSRYWVISERDNDILFFLSLNLPSRCCWRCWVVQARLVPETLPAMVSSSPLLEGFGKIQTESSVNPEVTYRRTLVLFVGHLVCCPLWGMFLFLVMGEKQVHTGRKRKQRRKKYYFLWAWVCCCWEVHAESRRWVSAWTTSLRLSGTTCECCHGVRQKMGCFSCYVCECVFLQRGHKNWGFSSVYTENQSK